MEFEKHPLYFPIVIGFIESHFDSFIRIINSTNNKEILNTLLMDEEGESLLSGEAKTIIINRMAELDDERSFEL